MDGILLQVIIFAALVLQGGLTRLLYAPLELLQSRLHSKLFSVVTDILIAVGGAAAMMLTCFLLADSVRVFYIVFFIGGMAIAHAALSKPKEKRAA